MGCNQSSKVSVDLFSGPVKNEETSISPTAMQISESATLKHGKWWTPQWKSNMSIT